MKEKKKKKREILKRTCRYLCVRVILGDFVQIVGNLGEGRVLVPGGDLISLQEIRAYREAVVLVPTSLDRFVSFVKVYRLRLHREPRAVQRVLGTFAVRRAPSKHNFGKLVYIGRQRTSLNRCWTPVSLQRHTNYACYITIFIHNDDNNINN